MNDDKRIIKYENKQIIIFEQKKNDHVLLNEKELELEHQQLPYDKCIIFFAVNYAYYKCDEGLYGLKFST